MTINNLTAYVDNLWDWGILEGCFGMTKIAVTDIDGIVERRGKFLLIEAKSPGKNIPRGQQYMFDSLIKTGVFTILVVWGEPGTPEKIHLITSKEIIMYDDANLEKMRDVVSQWFQFANKGT